MGSIGATGLKDVFGLGNDLELTVLSELTTPTKDYLNYTSKAGSSSKEVT